MLARSPSYRYAPFFMALLTNIELFCNLMDALYQDSHCQIRAWALHFNKYWFHVLLARVTRRQIRVFQRASSRSAAPEDVVSLIDRLLAMLQAPSRNIYQPYDVSLGFPPPDAPSLRPAHVSDDERPPLEDWPHPRRRSTDPAPPFPRLRWIDLLKRQRILLTNDAWGDVNYDGWWEDADIAPERLDDIARALFQPQPLRALPPALAPSLSPPSRPGAQPLSASGSREPGLSERSRPGEPLHPPLRRVEDGRHPP
ncbi:MAG: hypothetical protein IPK79_07600 [Vampirovibrionales bacterium]|nr:hypothetical protein [Vampirovibrionales bacterium]